MKNNKGGQRHVVDPKTKDKRSGNSLEFISNFTATSSGMNRGGEDEGQRYTDPDKHAWRNC